MAYSRNISHGELRERLARLVKGPVLGAGDPADEESRRVFNAMIERRPATILRCSCAEDVARGVTAARDTVCHSRLRAVATRSRETRYDGGLMLNMSSMKGVSVDPERDLAVAEAGLTLGVVVCWSGSVDEGERVLRPLREFGPPIADDVGLIPYLELQSMADAGSPPGRLHYWKASFLADLPGEAIDTILCFSATAPSPYTDIGMQQITGAASRIAPTATAFAHLGRHYDFLILSGQPPCASRPFGKSLTFTGDMTGDGHLQRRKDLEAGLRSRLHAHREPRPITPRASR